MVAQAARRHRTAAAGHMARRGLAWQRRVVGIALILMAVYITMPLFWLLFAVTKGNQTLFSTPGFWFGPDIQLAANVRWLFSYDGSIFIRWILNSIVYALIIAMVSTLISSMAGFAFAKYHFLGRRVIFMIVLGALMVPPAALVIPTFLFVKALGLIDTYAGVIVPLLASPFGVYFMRAYMSGAIPDELLDAGRVDGASELRLFRTIVLRIVAPGLVTLFLITFVGVWNNFFFPLVILSDEKLFPLTLGLAVWNSTAARPGTGQPLYPLVLTGSLLCILPLVALFLFLRRYIVNGLTLGGLR